MKKKNTIYALDLGTTKFCLAALITKNDTSKILEIFEVPASGMKKGMLVDFNEAKQSLSTLIEKAEKVLKSDIRTVVVGVAGSHLQGSSIERVLDLAGKEICETTLEQLSAKAEAAAQTEDREILHCIPIHFRIDHREPIDNPLGMTGGSLTAKYFMIDADTGYLKDMIRLCNLSGLQVVRLFSEPFASASVTVDEALKESGVAVADIGGGTTDGIVYQGGRPVDVFTVNIAGSLITRDICTGLSVNYDVAERLKLDVGLAGRSDKTIAYENLYQKQVTRSSLECSEIIGARVLELGAYLATSLKPYKGCLAGGLLFTGGGSRLQELNGFLSARFQINVQTAIPDCTHLGVTRELGGKYATAIGLLNLEIGRQKLLEDQSGGWAAKYLNQFFNWMKELS